LELKELEQAQQLKLQKRCCTVGKFESFHRGHRKLIETAKRICSEIVVISIRGLGKRIFSEEEREKIAESLNIRLLNVPFSEIRNLTPKEFMEFLKDLGCSVLVVGSEWKFGKNRAGDVNTAREIGKSLGIEVVSVETVKEDSEKISTSRILEFLRKGKVEEANKLLGFPYFAVGVVVKGKKLGREIGFPTVNIETQKELPLPFGVYAVRLYLGNRVFDGISNYGRAPTLKNSNPTLEVFIPEKELPPVYGQKVKVEFFKFLRPERKFNSVEELVNQIKFDLKNLREFWRERVGRGEEV
jgi:riboflavin kinase/FMN adenylyltransferase